METGGTVPRRPLAQWSDKTTCRQLTQMSIHCVSKKQSKLFSSELRQISINFDNFWHKDGQDNRIV